MTTNRSIVLCRLEKLSASPLLEEVRDWLELEDTRPMFDQPVSVTAAKPRGYGVRDSRTAHQQATGWRVRYCS